MLESLPRFVGAALKRVRPGLSKTIYARIPAPETIALSSEAFQDGGAMAARFTQDGRELSFPPRVARGAVAAAELMLVIEDADSPTPAPLVHLLAYGIAAADGRMAEGGFGGGAEPGSTPYGASLGRNSFGKAQYLPPDPPPGHGPHRYVVQAYALARPSGLSGSPGKREVVAALGRGVLAKGRLIGTYVRP